VAVEQTNLAIEEVSGNRKLLLTQNTTAFHRRKETTMTQTQPQKVLYTAKARTTGGRDNGASRTDDGRLDIQFSVPGKPGNGTNPEQLFATGWSACFLSAMGIAASKMNVALPADPAVDAEVGLCLAGRDDFSLRARLNVSLAGLEREVAQSLADAGRRLCPYSKATCGNIDVMINLD
jgi:Ohr subfamily peroxiredoxin